MEKLAAQLRLARLISEPSRQLLADVLTTTDVGDHALPGFPGTASFATF